MGSVAGERFIEAIIQLRRLGGDASGCAADDVYLTRGPLRLELRVEEDRGYGNQVREAISSGLDRMCIRSSGRYRVPGRSSEL